MRRFLLCILLLPVFAFSEDTAFQKYKAGELATTPEARKEAFNQALTLYLQMESDTPSPSLCFDIANTYYQLHEYGLAILYYNKALKLDPRFSKAYTNLHIALAKVNIPSQEPSTWTVYLFFWHYKLSHNEKAQAVLYLFFLVFGLLSVYIWTMQPLLKKAAYIALGASAVLLLSIVWGDYFSHPEAIVVRPVALRRDAGDQYAPVVGTPALAGTKVVVLSVQDDGNWLKVRTPSGEEGYVSKDYARII